MIYKYFTWNTQAGILKVRTKSVWIWKQKRGAKRRRKENCGDQSPAPQNPPDNTSRTGSCGGRSRGLFRLCRTERSAEAPSFRARHVSRLLRDRSPGTKERTVMKI